ncbi:MAG: hypothetical protein XXXJIFNMEKO3_02318 [Candidatus Erwinia impunctatus]|nr:hypothetical protein XXXJIFNMEKO_02318 [Culicoides impunctatus]
MQQIDQALFIKWLEKEVTPALGCTEPVAIAFAAATAGASLPEPCVRISGFISENLYKNAMGVTIPGTRSRGIAMAAAVGLLGGDREKGLELLDGLTDAQIEQAQEMVKKESIILQARETEDFIHIDLTAHGLQHQCRVVIKQRHTQVAELYLDGQPIALPVPEKKGESATVLRDFTIEEAVEFVNHVPLSAIAFMQDAAHLNSALSAEGRRIPYGLNISGVLAANVSLGVMSDDMLSRILIETVAASDARMGGASVPAMSNFGSGNQGIAATLPVVVLARELNAGDEALIRALALSHLTAIAVHARFMRLSALCAATTAAMGAAAGMAWLFTRDLEVVQSAIINMVSDVSGIICDGASNGCAMKVSTGTMSAFKAVLLARQGIRVSECEGIISRSTEQTLSNLSRLVVRAMPATDREIIAIMSEK